MAAENTKVAESKKKANAVGCCLATFPNGTHVGMCATTARSPANAAAANGMEPKEDASTRPFASGNTSPPPGTSRGTLASRAGRNKSETHSWAKASTYRMPMPEKGTRMIRPARTRSQVTMMSRRSRRSARTPPTGAAKMGGRRRSTSTTATAV